MMVRRKGGDSMAKFWEIDYSLQDAWAAIDRANDLACEMTADVPDGAWAEMDEFLEKLAEARRAIEATRTKGFKDCLASEKEDMDHLSDLADGASY
jgi:hypothetical protein